MKNITRGLIDDLKYIRFLPIGPKKNRFSPHQGKKERERRIKQRKAKGDELPKEEAFYCRSMDGQYKIMKEVVYRCPVCRREVRELVISAYQVNTTCKCRYPNEVHQMQCEGIFCPPGYKEIE